MSAGAVTITGILLGREISGERHLKLALLSEELGIVNCLLRISAKPSTTTAPDLFDVAEISMDPSRGNSLRFASDYRVLHRDDALGCDYQRLAVACRIALLLTKNPPPDESFGAIYALCLEVLHALRARPRPDAALFKFLWKLARLEGYPVQEHWLPALDRGDREMVAKVLRCPLDGQTTPTEILQRLTRGLEKWFSTECHFVLPG